MPGKAKDVTAWVTVCRDILLGFEETMDYGATSYKRNGVAEAGFASQRHIIGSYILRTDESDLIEWCRCMMPDSTLFPHIAESIFLSQFPHTQDLARLL